MLTFQFSYMLTIYALYSSTATLLLAPYLFTFGPFQPFAQSLRLQQVRLLLPLEVDLLLLRLARRDVVQEVHVLGHLRIYVNI